MKYLITGLSGTLAPRLASVAVRRGGEVVGWNRTLVDPEDAEASLAWLESTRPDVLFHLATGSSGWCGRLSRFAANCAIPFVYTSSAMVFDHDPPGPHHIDSERTAKDDYGRYKVACEDAILKENSAAVVARIGWQIDPSQSGNNMLQALDQMQIRDGHVAASKVWLPACSFMEDTATALIDLAHRPSPGVIHLDSNAEEGHSFVEVVKSLKQRFERRDWIIREHANYKHDQRLVGGAERMPPLSHRLPL